MWTKQTIFLIKADHQCDSSYIYWQVLPLIIKACSRYKRRSNSVIGAFGNSGEPTNPEAPCDPRLGKIHNWRISSLSVHKGQSELNWETECRLIKLSIYLSISTVSIIIIYQNIIYISIYHPSYLQYICIHQGYYSLAF